MASYSDTTSHSLKRLWANRRGQVVFGQLSQEYGSLAACIIKIGVKAEDVAEKSARQLDLQNQGLLWSHVGFLGSVNFNLFSFLIFSDLELLSGFTANSYKKVQGRDWSREWHQWWWWQRTSSDESNQLETWICQKGKKLFLWKNDLLEFSRGRKYLWE